MFSDIDSKENSMRDKQLQLQLILEDMVTSEKFQVFCKQQFSLLVLAIQDTCKLRPISGNYSAVNGVSFFCNPQHLIADEYHRLPIGCADLRVAAITAEGLLTTAWDCMKLVIQYNSDPNLVLEPCLSKTCPNLSTEILNIGLLCVGALLLICMLTRCVQLSRQVYHEIHKAAEIANKEYLLSSKI
jgi:hypothetical protein